MPATDPTAHIWEALASPDLETIRSGLRAAQAFAAGDPRDGDVRHRRKLVYQGITISSQGKVAWSRFSPIRYKVPGPRQLYVALGLLRATGQLDGVETIDLKGHALYSRLEALEPLAGLDSLRSLSIYNAHHVTDLSALQALPNLETLRVLRCRVLSDLSPLASLTGLRRLELSESANLTDLSPLAGLSALEHLELRGMLQLQDISPLAGLAGLRRLALDRALKCHDLSPLSGLTQLEHLDLKSCTGLKDLAVLSELTGLRSLDIGRASFLTEFSQLAGFAHLERLDLSWQQKLTDLSPLSGLTGLRELDLEGCDHVSDLAPLAGLTNLERLRVDGCPGAADLSPVQGLTGLAEGILVGSLGHPVQAGHQLSGMALRVAVAVAPALDGDHPLLRAGALSLEGLVDAAIPELEVFTGLRRLSLARSGALADVSPILVMGELERLDLSGCPAARPRPQHTITEGREAVARYQRRVARALERNKERTPAQDALLERARASGLMDAEAERRRQENRPTVTSIRKLLSAPDLDSAIQGFQILLMLEDPEMAAEFAEGVTINEGGQIAISASAVRRAHLRRMDRRQWMSLAVLRAAGRLDDVQRISIFARASHHLPDLTPLEHLSQLEHLSLSGVKTDNLTPLSTLTGLRTLTLRSCPALQDLSAIAELTGLVHLELSNNPRLQDVSALLRMPYLRSINLRGCPALPRGFQRKLRGAQRIAKFREELAASA